MELLPCDAFSRSLRLTTMAGRPTGGARQGEDPAIAIYRRFVDAWADYCEIQVEARGIHEAHGFSSAEYQRAEANISAAADRAADIYQELVELPVTSPAGLILLLEAVREYLLLNEDEAEARALNNISAGMRRLLPSEDLEVAEQLLAARKAAEI